MNIHDKWMGIFPHNRILKPNVIKRFDIIGGALPLSIGLEERRRIATERLLGFSIVKNGKIQYGYDF